MPAESGFFMRSIPDIQDELRRRSGSVLTEPVKAVPVPVSISIPPYHTMSLPQLRELSDKAVEWLKTHEGHPQFEAAFIRHKYLCKALADKAFAGG